MSHWVGYNNLCFRWLRTFSQHFYTNLYFFAGFPAGLDYVSRWFRTNQFIFSAGISAGLEPISTLLLGWGPSSPPWFKT
jgi:hypothetical protein